MPDLLGISVSGLIAFERALATTSHNIANAATEGYVRQRTDFAAREPQGYGSGFIGRGVDVTTVRRLISQFSASQLRYANSDLGGAQAFADLAVRVDTLLGEAGTDITASLQQFFAAVQDVATNPNSLAARQVMLARANSVADRFRSASQQLDRIQQDAKTQIRSGVDEVTRLAAGIAKLNGDITTATSAMNGQPPNDLLDERDRLLTRLSELVNVSVVDAGDGAVNVFIGSGQTLVLGSLASSLTAAPAAADASWLEIRFRDGGGEQVINSAITGGELGGLLEAHAGLLEGVRQQLGLTATALAAAVNAQQGAGFDLDGQFGAALFSVASPRVTAVAGNAGAAALSATVDDLATLTGENYLLQYDGSAWSVRRESDGSAVAATGAGTALDPLRFGGLALVAGVGAAAGDRFVLQSAGGAAGSLAVTLTDPRGIAAAAPIRTAAVAGNRGNGTISAGEVIDAADAALLDDVEIAFLDANTYSVNGAGAFAWAPGEEIQANGWSVRISGQPAAGDRFRVEENTGGTGDNRNALRLAALQDLGVIAGGSVSIADSASALVSRVGALAAEAETTAAARQTLQASAKNTLLAQSGVNLDEEATEMLKWQQAYQAAAQAISVADSMFRTLLAATQR
ncbi:MAG TPA: flagellar hook-associated protein FlgK [Solirubrobacteraceae bacterium]|nr:flagellar hook-associated protein FlgK [Solirubrobacteraceae bacterium]